MPFIGTFSYVGDGRTTHRHTVEACLSCSMCCLAVTAGITPVILLVEYLFVAFNNDVGFIPM